MAHAAQPSPLSFRYVYANEVIAIGAALPAVCILVVALRLVMHRLQHSDLKASDWLAVCALVSRIGSRNAIYSASDSRLMTSNSSRSWEWAYA